MISPFRISWWEGLQFTQVWKKISKTGRLEELNLWNGNKSQLLNKAKIGDKVDLRDTEFIWCTGSIEKILKSKYNWADIYYVHYDEWNKWYDEYIPSDSERIAPLKFFTSRTDIPKYTQHEGPDERLFGNIMEVGNQIERNNDSPQENNDNPPANTDNNTNQSQQVNVNNGSSQSPANLPEGDRDQVITNGDRNNSNISQRVSLSIYERINSGNLNLNLSNIKLFFHEIIN